MLRSPRLRRRRAAGPFPASATAEGRQLNVAPSLRRHSRAEGDIQKAIAALEAGIAVATQNGDAEVVRVLQHDLECYQRAAAGEEVDLSR